MIGQREVVADRGLAYWGGGDGGCRGGPIGVATIAVGGRQRRPSTGEPIKVAVTGTDSGGGAQVERDCEMLQPVL